MDAPHGTIDGPSGTIDSPQSTVDAGSAQATIKISGTAASESTSVTPEPGVVVGVFKTSDDSMLGSATTDGSGNFSITVSTGGVALDAYIKGTKSSFMDSYLYPPKPLTADFDEASVEMEDASFLDLLGQKAGNGFIGVQVLDASGANVKGAVVVSQSGGTANGTVEYDTGGTLAIPSASATSTGSDGLGYVFNTTPGSVTMTATKSGTTFSSHAVKTYANALTETVVEP